MSFHPTNFLNHKIREFLFALYLQQHPHNQPISTLHHLRLRYQLDFADDVLEIQLIKPRTQKLKSFQDKVIKTFIHGFLHLLNFDHIKNKDYKNMLREEDRIYKSITSKKY